MSLGERRPLQGDNRMFIFLFSPPKLSRPYGTKLHSTGCVNRLHPLPRLENGDYLADRPNVARRVTGKGDEIGHLARLDRAEFVG